MSKPQFPEFPDQPARLPDDQATLLALKARNIDLDPIDVWAVVPLWMLERLIKDFDRMERQTYLEIDGRARQTSEHSNLESAVENIRRFIGGSDEG